MGNFLIKLVILYWKLLKLSTTSVQDDSTELNDLNASRRTAQSLLLGAQQKLTDLVNADKLRYFADNLKEDWVDVDSFKDSKHRTLLEWMKAPTAKLINYDKLAIQCRKEGGKLNNIGMFFLYLDVKCILISLCLIRFFWQLRFHSIFYRIQCFDRSWNFCNYIPCFFLSFPCVSHTCAI